MISGAVSAPLRTGDIGVDHRLRHNRRCGPAAAELRLGFGRIDSTRDTIITRVTKGTLGIKDAVRQVQEFRRLKRTAGS